MFLSKGLVIWTSQSSDSFPHLEKLYLARQQPTRLSAYLFYGRPVLAAGDGLLCLYEGISQPAMM